MLLVLIYLSWKSETGFSLTTGYVFSINVSTKSIAFVEVVYQEPCNRFPWAQKIEKLSFKVGLSRYLNSGFSVTVVSIFSIQLSIECCTEGDSSPVKKVSITNLIRSLDSPNDPKSAISIDLSCISTLLLCTTSISSINVKIVKVIYKKEDSNENFFFDSSNSWKILRALLEMLVTFVCLLI